MNFSIFPFSNCLKILGVTSILLKHSYLSVHCFCILVYTFLGASLVAQMVKNLPAMQETRVRSLGWEGPLEKERLPTPIFMPGEFHGQKSLAARVHGVTKSWT